MGLLPVGEALCAVPGLVVEVRVRDKRPIYEPKLRCAAQGVNPTNWNTDVPCHGRYLIFLHWLYSPVELNG